MRFMMNGGNLESSDYDGGSHLGAAAYGSSAIGTQQVALPTGGVSATPGNYHPQAGGRRRSGRRFRHRRTNKRMMGSTKRMMGSKKRRSSKSKSANVFKWF